MNSNAAVDKAAEALKLGRDQKDFYNTIKIGVVGSRRRNSNKDKELLKEKILDLFYKFYPKRIILVSGGCPFGADRFAEELAEEIGLSILVHYPEKWSLPENPNKWNWTKIYYERNGYIAIDCDILVAMVAEDRTGGTEDTVKKTKRLDKEIILL